MTLKPPPNLKHFLHALTTAQQERFARYARTSLGTIRHLVTGRRGASAEMAIAIEKAAIRIHEEEYFKRDLNPRLPTRDNLCAACRECEYRKACTGRMD